MIRSFRESVFAPLGEIYFLDFAQKGKMVAKSMSTSVSRTNCFELINILDSIGEGHY